MVYYNSTCKEKSFDDSSTLTGKWTEQNETQNSNDFGVEEEKIQIHSLLSTKKEICFHSLYC